MRPLFWKQLESCWVEYFDFYLMHAQGKEYFEKFKKCRAYEQALELKAEGLIRHVGLSFHDKSEVLDEILTEYPQMEFVQLQLHYMGYDGPVIQGRQGCEVCAKHGKSVIVMEPVKGGNLVKLPEDALRYITDLHGDSPVGYDSRSGRLPWGVYSDNTIFYLHTFVFPLQQSKMIYFYLMCSQQNIL